MALAVCLWSIASFLRVAELRAAAGAIADMSRHLANDLSYE
jgi:hypothetical protein